MTSFGSSVLLQQLPAMIPFLLVCLAGIALGCAYMRPHPAPALFVLIGSALLLAVFVGQTLATQYLVHARQANETIASSFHWLLPAIGIVSSLLRALGYALLLVAAFVGRTPAPPPRAPDSGTP